MNRADAHCGLAGLLPPGVRCVEATQDGGLLDLFPVERAALAGCSTARLVEFATARQCARDALVALGVPPQALPPRLTGDPAWPSGIVGSITHCDGYRAAAVGMAADYLALGIDAEPNAGLPDRVLAAIAAPAEIVALRRLPNDGTAWDRLLFSAKEAAFKAWFPLTGRHIDPTEIAALLDPTGTFDATIDGFVLDGRWTESSSLVLTVVAVASRYIDASGGSDVAGAFAPTTTLATCSSIPYAGGYRVGLRRADSGHWNNYG